MNQLKVPPHNIEAEQGLLCGLLINSTLIPKIQTIIEPSDMYRETHIHILKGIFELGKKVDVITLGEWLEKRGLYEKIGGMDYLFEIGAVVSTSAGCEYHAEIVKEKSIERKIISSCALVSEHIFKPHCTADEALSLLKDLIRDIESNKRIEYITNKTIVNEIYKEIEEKRETGDNTVGVLTGFERIDEKLFGLEKECTYYLSAESHTGKSALAINISDYISRNYPGIIGYFTLESTKKILTRRRLSIHSQIALTRIRKGHISQDDEWSNFHNACGIVQTEDFRLLDDYKYSDIDNLISHCETLAMDNTINLIVIDHLQLMTVKGKFNNSHEKYKEISRRINGLAKILKVPVLVVSQVNADGKMKESRDIYSNADNVWLMEQSGDNRIRLEATKGKDSGLWSVWLNFDKYTQTFTDYEDVKTY